MLASGCVCCTMRSDLEETLRGTAGAAGSRRGAAVPARPGRDHRPRRSGADRPAAAEQSAAQSLRAARRRGDDGRCGARRRPARRACRGRQAGRDRGPAAADQDRSRRRTIASRRCARGLRGSIRAPRSLPCSMARSSRTGCSARRCSIPSARRPDVRRWLNEEAYDTIMTTAIIMIRTRRSRMTTTSAASASRSSSPLDWMMVNDWLGRLRQSRGERFAARQRHPQSRRAKPRRSRSTACSTFFIRRCC